MYNYYQSRPHSTKSYIGCTEGLMGIYDISTFKVEKYRDADYTNSITAINAPKFSNNLLTGDGKGVIKTWSCHELVVLKKREVHTDVIREITC